MVQNAELLEKDRLNRERLSKRDFSVNFLVSAGAGAGKTYLTVERAFNMLCDESLNVSPQDIVMITFTRKAATEMKVRLNKWIRGEMGKATDPEKIALLQRLLSNLPEMQISTIHSFCRKVLTDYPLESGVGFAPQFDQEDQGPDGRAERFFNNAWKSGRCPRSLRMSIPQGIARSSFSMLSGNPGIQVQFIDLSKPEGQAFAEEILNESRRLLKLFSDSLQGTSPSVFHYKIANALLAGEKVTEDLLLGALMQIAQSTPSLRGWMGKAASKTPGKACLELGSFLEEPGSDEALQVIADAFADAKKRKSEKRSDVIAEYIPGLPHEYRISAEIADMLPDDEKLAELAGKVNLLLHGILTGELLQLSREYADYRQRNHIVTLNDMMYLTANLIRNHPRVREKLHDRYKTFFVDEYQDTDPIQTDIIFGITADQYDPDWHKCRPRPGSLFLVGDAKQGIYRFRGADISLWQEAEDTIKASGGEVVYLYRNFRSTTQICQAVTDVFSASGSLSMAQSPYQAEYSEMVAERGDGPAAVINHFVDCDSLENGHMIASEQIAQMIRDRVDSGENQYEDFLLLSFFREKHLEYADALRRRGIPVKFDGALPTDAYPPLQLLNLRVQAVCHPFDESLSFRVLARCGGVLAEEWDMFRMTVKQLPEETRLTKFRNIRSLMGHVSVLKELLPDTGMNRKIMNALEMMDRDRKLSQQRTPCAFLEETVENAAGLFTADYGSEEFQNQYAALLQVIDSIRSRNPQHFEEMADQLKTCAESAMDRMPSVRADANFVRLMNLHKAKGLQGKIVIFLPEKLRMPPADCNLVRQGGNVLGWFELKEKNNYLSAKYCPPDWENRKKEEEEFLKAEKVRLRYVALTRAEDEAHIFIFRQIREGKEPQLITAWDGFYACGEEAPAIGIPEDDEPADTEKADPEGIDMERMGLEEKKRAVRRTAALRCSPSSLDGTGLSAGAGLTSVQDLNTHGGRNELFTKPGGTEWGTVVHQTAERLVLSGEYTGASLETAADAAVKDRFPTELLTKEQRMALLIPSDRNTLGEIHEYLKSRICDSLRFMTDKTSAFRQMTDNGVCYPELPFVLSVSQENGEIYESLKALTGSPEGKTLEISGTIDLAVRYPDKTWQIIDYKTDRMLPCDGGDPAAFHARLNAEYGTQLQMYKAILEYLTGEAVRSATLLSV